MTAARVLEMALYDPNEKQRPMKAFTFRLEEELIADMDDCVRLWRMYAAARGEDTRGIDRSFVMRRFLRSGRDNAFAEFGGRPKSEEDWSRIEAAILKAVKKSTFPLR